MSEIKLWNNIQITEETKKHRNQIRSLMDEFTDFQWQGYSAFENFGAFIINENRSGLKFYNGQEFSNEYSKPQFDENSGELMGVTFNRQTISFTIGVYWISVEHYRQLINWLNPLTISYIMFGFEPKYRYNVKLSKLGDSTRWIVGKENGKPMYYTELQLTFEVQGAQCAKGMNSYEFDVIVGDNVSGYLSKTWNVSSDGDFYYTKFKTQIIKNNNKELALLADFIKSDLATPFSINLDLPLVSLDLSDLIENEETKEEIILSAVYKTMDAEGEESVEELPLFNLVLSNLTYSLIKKKTEGQTEDDLLKEALESAKTISINYNSENGLLFLSYGSIKKLLTLVSTTDTGERIVDSFVVNKFSFPGQFDWAFDYTKFELRLKWSRRIKDGDSAKNIPLNTYIDSGDLEWKPSIECYPRTNVI